MTRRNILALSSSILIATSIACRGAAPASDAAASATLVGRENSTIARQETLQVGPSISGTLEAEHSATVRAEVGGAVLAVLAEPGQAVEANAVLARIDETGFRDGVLSAQAAVRSAEINAALARRNAERSRRLAEAGAVAERDLEQAEWILSTAETQLADANARLASAEKQVEKTILRAPFSGIIGDRPINAGDIVQPGMPLFIVVDPRSLKLEGALTAEALSGLKVGTPVRLTVSGQAGPLEGRITRIYPTVDPATRQVRVTVALPNTGGRFIAGLFAEGRAVTASRVSVVVPTAVVDRRGLRPFVVRVRDGTVERVEVDLGLIDDAREEAEIVTGLTPGDTLLLGGSRGLPEGTRVQISDGAEAAVGKE
jgi:membrane fusion protein (multidrug efflux system)